MLIPSLSLYNFTLTDPDPRMCLDWQVACHEIHENDNKNLRKLELSPTDVAALYYVAYNNKSLQSEGSKDTLMLQVLILNSDETPDAFFCVCGSSRYNVNATNIRLQWKRLRPWTDLQDWPPRQHRSCQSLPDAAQNYDVCSISMTKKSDEMQHEQSNWGRIAKHRYPILNNIQLWPGSDLKNIGFDCHKKIDTHGEEVGFWPLLLAVWT